MELLEDEGVVPEDVEEDLGVEEELVVVFVVEFDDAAEERGKGN